MLNGDMAVVVGPGQRSAVVGRLTRASVVGERIKRNSLR